jgi:hypothetical protein
MALAHVLSVTDALGAAAPSKVYASENSTSMCFDDNSGQVAPVFGDVARGVIFTPVCRSFCSKIE